MKKYLGELSREETQAFLLFFYKFYCCVGTKVTITPDKMRDKFSVLLEPEENFFSLLESLFNDGAQKRRGWMLKFKEVAV